MNPREFIFEETSHRLWWSPSERSVCIKNLDEGIEAAWLWPDYLDLVYASTEDRGEFMIVSAAALFKLNTEFPPLELNDEPPFPPVFFQIRKFIHPVLASAIQEYKLDIQFKKDLTPGGDSTIIPFPRNK